MKLFSKFALPSSSSSSSGLGFGCMGITAFYGESLPVEKAVELLRTVYDAGCRHFDTAEVYATEKQHNETVLGEFFKTVPRDTYSVATKFFPRGGDKYDYDTLKARLMASLERLGLDYVDLYYAHRLTDLDGAMEFARNAKRLKEEGLIKEVGLSEVSAVWLRKIHTEACAVDAIQMEWSLLTRNIEEDVVTVCKELDITVVAYSPLARNMLAAKVEQAPSDWRGGLPRYSEENLKKNQDVVAQVRDLAEKYNCTAAQLSLAWLFHKADQLGVSVVPIPGSSKLAHAVSNLESVKVNISEPEDLEKLEILAAQVAGDRAMDWYMKGGFENQK